MFSVLENFPSGKALVMNVTPRPVLDGLPRQLQKIHEHWVSMDHFFVLNGFVSRFESASGVTSDKGVSDVVRSKDIEILQGIEA